MPPRKVKSDPEVKSQESPDLFTIEPVPGNTTSPGIDTTSGFQLQNPSLTHPLPVIHETGVSYFSSQFPGVQGTTQGFGPDPFLYPNISGIGNIPNASQGLSAFNTLYSTGDYSMNNMSRNILPSSGNARNQVPGSSGTGAGVTKRPPRQPRQAGSVTGQAVSRAALGMAFNPGQANRQQQGFDVDLTGMDYATGSPTNMGFYGSTLNSGMDPNSFASSGYNPLANLSAGMQQNPQQNPQHQDYRNMSPVPKFDPDLLSTSPDLVTPNQYESFGEDEYETKPDPRRIHNEGTPTRPPRKRRTSMAQADVSPATANTSSPANSSFDTVDLGGGGGQQAASAPAHLAHVPPNRIAEAGPVTHPDPEWRPYGVNHWHVFLREPTTLKYLSSTEIKDIREHCYELASKAGGGGGGDGDEDQGQEEGQGPQPVAEGSPYTTADAQAVWRHCDAYVRRRGQVRNNQAARRSRQRKDAETRYWRAKAIEYGAPDVEFDWSLVEDSPPAAQGGGGSSSRAAAAGAAEGGGTVQTRAQARARAQTGQGRAQLQQGEGQGQMGRGGGGGRQGQAAARRASAPSAAPPDFDFNQPLDHDEDDSTHSAGFDAFTGEF